MIDVHAHIFNFKYVPDGYFRKYSVRREGVGKVSVFLDKFFPWTDRDRLSSYARFLRTGSSESMKEILDAMARALAEGHRIEIRGFGSFALSHRPPRVGRNPKSGERVHVPEKRVPHFKPGKELRERVDAAIKDQ